MTPVAIAFGVLEMTGDARQVAIVVSAQIAAQVATQLLAGALADRGSRQSQMVRADGLAAASQAVAAALLISGQAEIWMLALLMAANGVAMAFHGPAAVGIVTQVVRSEELQPANALLGMARSGSISVGAATAGLLVATAGAGWALAVDATSFAASAAWIATLAPRAQRRGESANLWRELREGWQEFTSHRWLWVIVLQFSVLLAAVEGVGGVIGPTVALRSMGGASDWGWIASATGAGTLVGGFVSLRVRAARPMYMATLLCFGFTLPALLLSGPAPVTWVAAASFVSGGCGQLFAVLWYTTLHQRVAPEALSRVSAYDHVGSIGLAPLGVVAAGVLLETIGPRPTLWIAAAVIAVPTAAALCVREVRELRTSEPR